MNSCWPSRKRWYSAGIGSLTLTIRSAAANTSSASGDHGGAGGGVLLVREPRAGAGAGLDQDPVAVVDQLGGTVGDHRDAVLVVLDLTGDSDDERHAVLLRARRGGDDHAPPARPRARRAPAARSPGGDGVGQDDDRDPQPLVAGQPLTQDQHPGQRGEHRLDAGEGAEELRRQVAEGGQVGGVRHGRGQQSGDHGQQQRPAPQPAVQPEPDEHRQVRRGRDQAGHGGRLEPRQPSAGDLVEEDVARPGRPPRRGRDRSRPGRWTVRAARGRRPRWRRPPPASPPAARARRAGRWSADRGTPA